MARIFEKILTKMDKENELKISYGASLLPSYDADLYVKDRSTGNVLKFDYKVSGRVTPIIRGNKWLKFIGRYEEGATITLYKYDGSDANYKILVRN